MRLILTRHGETIENKADLIQGWLPGHLSRAGKKQAQQVAKRLKWLKIDFLYSSDLHRCLQTAEEIIKYHPKTKLVPEPLLREINTGDFSGKKHSEVDWKSLPGDITTNRPPNGESFTDVRNRVEKFYNRLLKRHLNETVLVVGHGGTLGQLIGAIKQLSISESFEQSKQISNTGIYEYEIDARGNFEEICANCAKHGSVEKSRFHHSVNGGHS